MKMNDNTILRIKVPAHLYEAVKAQLTLSEAKKGAGNYGAGMEVVKEKKAATPKAASAHKKEKMEVPNDGMKKTAPKKKKKLSMEDFKNLHEMLGEMIKGMEEMRKKPEEQLEEKSGQENAENKE